MDELTPKIKRFCEEYIKDLNGTQAAIRAGYSFHIHPGNKFFVYCLIDPRSDHIFYIGKGKGKRPYDHIVDYKKNRHGNQFKYERIGEIISAGEEVEIRYLGVELEEIEAFQLEHFFIKTIGTKNLTNISGGISKESVKQWAINYISRTKSLSKYISEGRGHEDIESYLMIVSEVTRLRDHGMVTDIIIDQDGKVTQKIRY